MIYLVIGLAMVYLAYAILGPSILILVAILGIIALLLYQQENGPR